MVIHHVNDSCKMQSGSLDFINGNVGRLIERQVTVVISPH